MSFLTPESTLALMFLLCLLSAFIGLFSNTRTLEKVSLGLLVFATTASAIIGALVTFGVLPPLLLSGFTTTFPLLYGMTFALDKLSGIFFTLANTVIALSTVFAIRNIDTYSHLYHVRFVCFLTALSTFALEGILLSTSAIGFLLFLQTLTFANFFVVMADGTKTSREAGMKYFVTAEIGFAAITCGLFLFSHGAVSADFGTIKNIIVELSPLTIAGASMLLLFGFGSRAALAPFHGWFPPVMRSAPSHIAAMFAALNAEMALYGLMRTVLFLLPSPPSWLGYVMVAFGMLSALLGVLSASVEHDVRKLLAYDSVQQTGLIFLLLGVAFLATKSGFVAFGNATIFATFIIIIAHALVKSGMLLAAGVVEGEVHTTSLEGMGGLAKRMPKLSFLLCLLALSSAALPPSGAFLGQWMFVQSLLLNITSFNTVLQVVSIAVLASLFFINGLALFTMVKFFSIAFLGRSCSLGAENAKEPAFELLLPIFLLMLLGILIGVVGPELLWLLGATDYVSSHGVFPAKVIIGAGKFSPMMFILALLGAGGAVYGFRQVFSRPAFERMQTTWDGGQPLTPRMEYTATAFSSPIRFFFRFLLKSKKSITETHLLTTNPWFTAKSFHLHIEPLWDRVLFAPLQKFLAKVLQLLRRLQSTNVQVYVAMILITLAISILVAL